MISKQKHKTMKTDCQLVLISTVVFRYFISLFISIIHSESLKMHFYSFLEVKLTFRFLSGRKGQWREKFIHTQTPIFTTTQNIISHIGLNGKQNV